MSRRKSGRVMVGMENSEKNVPNSKQYNYLLKAKRFPSAAYGHVGSRTTNWLRGKLSSESESKPAQGWNQGRRKESSNSSAKSQQASPEIPNRDRQTHHATPGRYQATWRDQAANWQEGKQSTAWPTSNGPSRAKGTGSATRNWTKTSEAQSKT